MRESIIHISDLHFGAHNDEAARELLLAINQEKPDLCIISGDFTQTGSRSEFAQARAFISAIQAPLLCVPGNHDIPHYQILHRLSSPFGRYKKFITSDLFPVSIHQNFIVIGINTARPFLPHWNWAHGKISARQLIEIRRTFEADHGNKVKIVVCHHPLHEIPDLPLKVLVWGRTQALSELNALKADLILTGHAHHASVVVLEEDGHRLTAVAAATAISTRLRHQENGYNRLLFDEEIVQIDTMKWNGNSYEIMQEQIIKR